MLSLGLCDNPAAVSAPVLRTCLSTREQRGRTKAEVKPGAKIIVHSESDLKLKPVRPMTLCRLPSAEARDASESISLRKLSFSDSLPLPLPH